MRTDPTGRVLVVGDIATDILAVLPAPLSGGLALGTDTAVRIGLSAGGSAANTAAWLATTGTPVTLIGAVGTDDAGAARLAELTAAGVDCAVERVAGNTGAIVVLSDPADRTMLCDRGANHLLSPAHVTAAVRDAGARHLHLSAYPLFDEGSRPAALAALAAARDAGLTTSIDAASAAPLRAAGDAAADWLRGTDLLFANLDEARVLVGDPAADPADAARALTALARSVVVKLGPDGAVRATADDLVRVPAVAVEAVDPTGAGDAFAAGLLAAELSGADPAASLRAGATLGARAVATLGARPR
ncbi:sugar kinase [Actinocatenispora rupis]|uniref:carbohydrate kinase family protein n=1 Tax=Actinocatenispora rupis TaxID=519421 RepID=UPI0031EF6A53